VRWRKAVSLSGLNTACAGEKSSSSIEVVKDPSHPDKDVSPQTLVSPVRQQQLTIYIMVYN